MINKLINHDYKNITLIDSTFFLFTAIGFNCVLNVTTKTVNSVSIEEKIYYWYKKNIPDIKMQKKNSLILIYSVWLIKNYSSTLLFYILVNVPCIIFLQNKNVYL